MLELSSVSDGHFLPTTCYMDPPLFLTTPNQPL